MNVDTFLVTNSSKFPAIAVVGLREQLQDAPDGAKMAVMTAGYREPVVALLLSFFLGALGIDRFYSGDTALGVAKLVITVISFGMLGFVWWFIDLFLIMKATRQKNLDTAMTMLHYAAGREQGAPVQDDSSDFDDF